MSRPKSFLTLRKTATQGRATSISVSSVCSEMRAASSVPTAEPMSAHNRRRDGGTQQNLAVAEVFHGGGGKSGAVDDLIRAHREMGGDAGHQIGGQEMIRRPGDGVHKAREKHERQDDEIGDRRQLHKTTSFCKYRQNHSTGAKKCYSFSPLCGKNIFDSFRLQRRHAWSIVTFAAIEALLRRHGFHFSKSMGQNFLIDASIPAAIAEASEAGEMACWRSAPASARSAMSSAAARAGSLRSSWTRRCCPFWMRRWRTSITSRSSPPISSRPTFPPSCARSSRGSRSSSARTCPITSRRPPSRRCSSQVL